MIVLTIRRSQSSDRSNSLNWIVASFVTHSHAYGIKDSMPAKTPVATHEESATSQVIACLIEVLRMSNLRTCIDGSRI